MNKSPSKMMFQGRASAISARTFADTQFMLEASFNAVSDLIYNEPSKYVNASVEDKILQFMSLLCH